MNHPIAPARPRDLFGLGALALIMILAGCGSPTSPVQTTAAQQTNKQTAGPSESPTLASPAPQPSPATQPPLATPLVEPVDRNAVLAEPEVVAAMLADPTQRSDGIVSLLADLGVGVYTPTGQQILQGSETKEDDFFLYDFEIPLLASMASEPARPFSELHDVLARGGYAGSPAELSSSLATAFHDYPDTVIARLFAAMNVGPDQPELTPLQSWLLLLSLAPPNGGRPTATAALAVAAPRVASCGGMITNAGVVPIWSASPTPWVDETLFQNAVAYYYALQGPILWRAVTASVTVDPASVHEGHGGPGQTAQLKLAMELLYIPLHIILGGCGTLLNQINPHYGPVGGVPVEWDLPPGLSAHGTLAIPGNYSFTDTDGHATVTYTAQEEASDGQGQEQSLASDVFAVLSPQFIFQFYLGISDRRLLVFVPEKELILGPLTVTWHGPSPSPSPSATQSATPTAVSPAVLPVACALASAAEVAAIVGEPVTAAENPDAITNPAIQSNCFYAGASRAAIVLSATAPGSLEAIIAQRDVSPIPGLGDQAYTWNLGGSTSYAAAQVGDVVLMVALSTTAYPAAVATNLLKLAVSHL